MIVSGWKLQGEKLKRVLLARESVCPKILKPNMKKEGGWAAGTSYFRNPNMQTELLKNLTGWD